MPAKIRPILAVLCDDIREERNGKPFILGVYNAGINVEMPPYFDPSLIPENAEMPLSLALWIPFEVLEIGEGAVNFKLVGPGPSHKIAVKAQLKIEQMPDPNELTAFSFTGLVVPIKEGKIDILFKHDDDDDDDEWQTIRSVQMNIKSSSLPTETLPPS